MFLTMWDLIYEKYKQTYHHPNCKLSHLLQVLGYEHQTLLMKTLVL